jgi:hypothetical protein
MIAGHVIVGRLIFADNDTLVKRSRHFHAMRLVGIRRSCYYLKTQQTKLISLENQVTSSHVDENMSAHKFN